MSPRSLDVEQSLRRHGSGLRRLAHVLLRNDADAEDAVQELWLGALRRPPNDHRAIGAWLSSSLHNIARKLRRADGRRLRRQAAVAREAWTEDHAAELARAEQAHRLIAAVSALRQPFRDAIWQRYFEGMAPRDISLASGEPIATVRSRLQRGLQELRTRLEGARESDWRGALAVAFGLRGAAPAETAMAIGQGVLLMTTWTKWIAGLAIGAALVWLVTNPGGVRPDANDVAAQRPNVAATRPPEDLAPDPHAGPQRVPVAPAATVATDPTSVEVLVRTEGAGEAVAGANVLFVKPGFAYADLPAAQQDRYSRSTEGFLRDFGVCLVTDEHGVAHIPIAAASWAVLARKGNLCGRNWPRSAGRIQEIVVSEHHTLVVETTDAGGNPVPHVEVVCRSAFDFFSKWTFGTTDDNGMLTYVLEPVPAGTPDKAWLQAELLDGAHGRQEIDRRTPPSFVRLILPPTGTVRARITGAGGAALDRAILDSMHAELALAGADPSRARYCRLDADGTARFENIVLGQKLQLRFPGVIVAPQEFAGPTEAERVVTIARTMAPDHPFVVGTLVNARHEPIAGEQIAIFCRRDGRELASVGAETDAEGRFLVFLSETCLDARGVEFTLAMDMTGTGFARKARVAVAGALRGRIALGETVMPGGD
ncbi:MAG: RNA polymerase sigma factor [Planctomycetota bacterium]